MAYDVYGQRPEDEEDESFSEESDDVVDEEGESEDEMRNYNMPSHPRGANNSFSSYSMASHARPPIFGPDEIYNLGLINLEPVKNSNSVLNKTFRKWLKVCSASSAFLAISLPWNLPRK